MENDLLSPTRERQTDADAQQSQPDSWRRSWGELAPAVGALNPNAVTNGNDTTPPPSSNAPAPWRRNWGELAPSASALNPNAVTNGNDTTPPPSSNAPAPWRRNRGELAPSASTPAPNIDAPTDNNKSSVMPEWNQYIANSLTDTSALAPAIRKQSIAAGTVTTARQDQIIADSLRSKTSVTGYLYTGALSGASLNAFSYLADHQLLKTSPESYTQWQKRWSTFSPAMKALNSYCAELEAARQAFSCADTKLSLTRSELNALRYVPENMLTSAQVDLAATRSTSAEGLKQASAQLEYLRRITEFTTAGEVRAAIGSRSKLGYNGIVFDHNSALGKRMRYYASSIENGCFPRDSFIMETAALQRKMAALSVAASQYTTNKSRVQFFLDGKAGSLQAVKEAAGTAAEIAANEKLFLDGSPELEQLVTYATKSSAHADATEALLRAEKVLASKHELLKSVREAGASIAHGSMPGTIAKGFGRGLGIAAGALALGYGVDTLAGQSFNYTPKQDGLTRFLLDGAAIPSVMLSNLPTRIKLPVAIGLFGAARVGDTLSGGSSSLELSTLMRPNTLDAASIPLLTLSPLSIPHKLAALAAEFAVGRSWNLIASTTGWDGNNGLQLSEQLDSLRNLDAITCSERSFMDAVQKTEQVATQSPAVVEQLLMLQYERTTLHPLEQARALALLSYGLGLARLRMGSRLSASDHNESSYFLRGSTYDFGGTAAEQIQSALTSLDNAKTYALNHSGETVSGRPIDSACVQRLDCLREKIRSTLNNIYGEQKLKPVYSEIRKQCRSNMEQVVSFIKEKEGELKLLGPTLTDDDRRYVAKVARDLTIANLAYADYCLSMSNGEDAATFFAAAEQHLACSRGLEDSPNLPQLSELLDRVRTKIPGATRPQWSNEVNRLFKLRS